MFFKDASSLINIRIPKYNLISIALFVYLIIIILCLDLTVFVVYLKNKVQEKMIDF